jgi:translation initiation factor 1
MSGLFSGTPLERPITCERCGKTIGLCACPRDKNGRTITPADQPVRVRREKRRGKFVTVIADLQAGPTPELRDAAALLKHFKTSLATGGTVSEGEIELQGDHRDKVVEALKAFGYPAKPAGG